MSVLCQHKQRAGLQREQPCSGKTGETAPASPAAENHKKNKSSDSELMCMVK